MRYLVTGYYGMRNVGDDVLLYVTLAGTERVDANAAFTIISTRSETTPPRARARLVPGGRRLENVRQMLRHDVWLFGGGGLLQDESPKAVGFLHRLEQSARVVKMLGRKIVLLGVGVGPLATSAGRAAARSLLEQADLVTVRDAESRALAIEIAPAATVHVTADLAFLLPRYAPATLADDRRPRNSSVLGVSLLPYARSLGHDGRGDDEVASAVARTLKPLLERHRNWDIELFEFFAGSGAYGDARVLRLVEGELGMSGRVRYRPYTGDFLSVYSAIGACEAFVGMRFHSCLLAYAAGVPCLMIAYHPKSESLAARLSLHPDAVAPLPLLQDQRALASRIDALLSNGAKFRPAVPLDALTLEADRTFTLLAEQLVTPLRASRRRR